MVIPDIWSLITGLASIVSLLLSLNERFAGWKRYSIPTGCVLAGFAIGRISPGMSSQDSGLLMIIFVLLAAAVVSMIYMLKHEQPGYAYMMPVVILTLVLPTTISSYYSANPRFTQTDLIDLVHAKEQKADFEGAITYFKLYVKLLKDDDVKKHADEKLKDLKVKLNSQFKTPENTNNALHNESSSLPPSR